MSVAMNYPHPLRGRTTHCDACGAPYPSTFLDITLDSAANTVSRGSYVSKLTAHEFTVLELMVKAHGRVLSNEFLFSSVYANKSVDEEPDSNMTKIWVHHLRPKLKPLGLGIRLVWGTGYALCRIEEALAAKAPHV